MQNPTQTWHELFDVSTTTETVTDAATGKEEKKEKHVLTSHAIRAQVLQELVRRELVVATPVPMNLTAVSM